MAYLGRKGAVAPLTSADIPAGIVEGTDIAFLENASGQDLSGTYSTERMYLAGRTGSAPNDYNYKLVGNIDVTGHLALGTVADSDVVITQDSTERTITGSGTLEAGEVLSSKETNLTGMTGELGSAVTFPAGMVRQVKWANMGAVATGDTEVYLPNSIQFSNPILASSDVWMSASGCGAKRAGSNDVNLDAWFSSADGGSLGEGTSGFKWLQDFGAYSGTVAHFHDNFTGTYLVTNPGSTTPTFRIYIDRAGDYEIHFIHMTIMEITG